jgi:hypothetical protein
MSLTRNFTATLSPFLAIAVTPEPNGCDVLVVLAFSVSTSTLSKNAALTGRDPSTPNFLPSPTLSVNPVMLLWVSVMFVLVIRNHFVSVAVVD